MTRDNDRPMFILTEGQARSAWAVVVCLLLVGVLIGLAVTR